MLCLSAGANAQRVRVAAPTLGERLDATATPLPDGTVLVGGAGTPGWETYEPRTNRWSPLTAPPLDSHSMHGAVLLPDLRVMVLDYGTPGNEVLDLRSRTWSAAPTTSHRVDAMGCWLSWSQRLVVAGGNSGGVPGAVGQQLTVFDPSANTWGTPIPRGLPHEVAMAPLLDGSGLVFFGGAGGGPQGVATSHRFSLGAQSFSALPDLSVPRRRAHAITQHDGTVLVFGGNATLETQRFDPATNGFSPGPALVRDGSESAAVMLPNGDLWLAGGPNRSAQTQRYSLATGTWSDGPPLNVGRERPTMTVLPTGRVLVAGGADGGEPTDVLDHGPGRWTAVTPVMSPRSGATVTRLPDGHVLLAGGRGAQGVLAEAWLVSPSGVPSTAASMRTARERHAAALLADGRLLVVGGSDALGAAISSAELYEPSSNRWRTVRSPQVARAGATLTALPDGSVLLVGGGSARCERYEPRTDVWSEAAPLPSARQGHQSVVEPRGTVLVTGGGTVDVARFTPSTGTWSVAGTLGSARSGHTVTALPDGRFLLVGGSTASTEIFDGATSIPGPNLATPRLGHRTTLLRDGTVLVMGGNADGQPVSERFDPLGATVELVPTAVGIGARADGALVRLSDGRVLYAGGRTSQGPSAELDVYEPDGAPLPIAAPTVGVVETPSARELRLSGTQFRGRVLGTTATSYGSHADFPLVSFEHESAPPQLGLTTAFTTSNATVALPDGVAPGWWVVRVIANGVSSVDRAVLVGAPSAPCADAGQCSTGSCVDGTCRDPLCSDGGVGFCNPPPPAPMPRLSALTPPRTFIRGACSGPDAGVVVQLEDEGGQPLGAEAQGLMLTPSSTLDVRWFTDSTCESEIDGGVLLPGGRSALTLHLRAGDGGTGVIRVSAPGVGTPLEQPLTVLALEPGDGGAGPGTLNVGCGCGTGSAAWPIFALALLRRRRTR